VPRFIVDRSSTFTRLRALRSSLASIADEMLKASRDEKAVGADISEKSVIGLLRGFMLFKLAPSMSPYHTRS
jgi:hypothetical protein